MQAVERTQINVSALGCHYGLTKRPTCYSFNVPQYIQFLWHLLQILSCFPQQKVPGMKTICPTQDSLLSSQCVSYAVITVIFVVRPALTILGHTQGPFLNFSGLGQLL